MIALTQDPRPNLRAPSDYEPHQCFWMAWSVHRGKWDKPSANKIKRKLSEVVQTIACYEPVRILAPRGLTLWEARREFAGCRTFWRRARRWMRDIMPTFALRARGAMWEVIGIDWNLNGWGRTPDRPARARDRLTKFGGEIFSVPSRGRWCAASTIRHQTPVLRQRTKRLYQAVYGLERLRQIAPRRSRSQDPENTVEGTAIDYPRHPTRLVGQHRLEAAHLIGELVAHDSRLPVWEFESWASSDTQFS